MASIQLKQKEIETHLAPYCMCCGERSKETIRKTFRLQELDLGGPKTGAFLAIRALQELANSETIELKTTFCENHRNYWRDRLILLLGGMIGFFALMLIGGGCVVVLATLAKVESRWPEGLLFLTAICYLSIWLYTCHRVFSKSIRVRGLTGKVIEIQNLSDRYIERHEQYQRQRQQDEASGIAEHRETRSEGNKPIRRNRSKLNRKERDEEPWPESGRKALALPLWLIITGGVFGFLLLGGLAILAGSLLLGGSKPSQQSISTAPPRPAKLEDVDDPQDRRPRVYLSDLQELNAKVGYGTFGKNGQLGYGIGGANLSPITVSGQAFPKAISTHPPHFGNATVQYTLEKNYREFHSWVAVNDLSDTNRTGPEGLLKFKVIGDGMELWTSEPVTNAGSIQLCQVNVFRIQVLELQATCSGTNESCRAVWLQPYLVK